MGAFFVLVVVAVIVVAIAVGIAKWLKDDPVDTWATGIVAGFIAICVLVGSYFGSFYNERVETCTVTSKDRGGDNGSYRVYTSDCGTLENTDAKIRGKFDSADVWQQIPEQGTVTIRVVGARVPFISWFPNILEVTSVQQSS